MRCDFPIADLKEWICAMFCYKLEKTLSDMHKMLKTAFGDVIGRTDI
jgi:hypothetical protein